MERPADHFLPPVAGHPAERVVDVEDRPPRAVPRLRFENDDRVVGVGGPTIHQNFGWSPGDDRQGAIGGEVWSTTTPATYGMPIGPFDLTRELSASGKVLQTTDFFAACADFWWSRGISD